MTNNQIVRVYDLADCTVDMSRMWDWLKTTHTDLFNDYRVKGKTNIELKRSVRPRVLEIIDEATEQGLYEMLLFPDVPERLATDRDERYSPILFTSSPPKLAQSIMRNAGLSVGRGEHSVDAVVSLEDIRRATGKPNLMKEDPNFYDAAASFIREYVGVPACYADDDPNRLQPAVGTNERLGDRGMGKLYLVTRKDGPTSPIQRVGYTEIGDLMQIGMPVGE